jgi:tetratricopeptide (TPR) repeat protein
VRPQVLSVLLVALSTVSALAQTNLPEPVTCTQVIAWAAGGMPSQRIARLAFQRGLAFPLDAAASWSLSEAGLEATLLQSLRGQSLRAQTTGRSGSECPESLVHASELVHLERYREAQPILQSLIAAAPDNSALHFAMGYVHQKQDDWDDASDSYEAARALMPELSDIHSRLAYVF